MVVVSNLWNSLTAESIIQYFIISSDLVVGVYNFHELMFTVFLFLT